MVANVIPFSLFQELQFGELKSTSASLQLVDGSLKHPRGIIENMLVKVDKYYFPTDFIMLDMEVNQEITIIFGHPFLATCRAKFDVKKGY